MILMIVRKNLKPVRLWVPKVVSYNPNTKKGYDSKGTKAFVLQGTRVAKGLNKNEKRLTLRQIATQADFFIKPLSKRNKKIRELLQKQGIKVEKVLQELHNGKALFQKEGVGLNSLEGIRIVQKNPKKVIDNLLTTMAKISSIDIIHGHPHLGNFAITPNGEIIVLDLGKATIQKSETKNTFKGVAKNQLRARKDLEWFCNSLTLYYYKVILRKEVDLVSVNKKLNYFWKQLHYKISQINHK